MSGGSYVWSHFKGLGFIGDRMIMSHTDINKLTNTPTNGWLLYADNPLALTSYPAAPTGSAGNPCFITATLPTQPSGWLHPCSLQVCGTFLAMGIQSGSSASTSVIQIYDARNALLNLPLPSTPLYTIQRTTNAVNGVGMTQATNGNYIVAAVNGSDLDIYVSQGSSLFASSLSFNTVLSVNNFNASGAGLGLVTQENGDIYLFALNAGDSGSNQLSLYQLTNLQGGDSSPACKQYGNTLTMTVASSSIPGAALSNKPEMALLGNVDATGAIALAGVEHVVGSTGYSTYRWGKGLRIMSNTQIELYATDRNAVPWSRTPVVGVDWSMLVWAASGSSVGPSTATTTSNLGNA